FRLPPICSGSEVVGAATIPPVAVKVRPLRRTRELLAASVQAPAGEHRDDHLRQNVSTRCNACSASPGCGRGRGEGPELMTKGIVQRGLMWNSPRVFMPSRRGGAVVRKPPLPGPAIADMPPSARRSTQGTTEP